jgi:hypothetical protein
VGGDGVLGINRDMVYIKCLGGISCARVGYIFE